MIISRKHVIQELHTFIDECNGNLLAALYGHVFGHLINVTWNSKEDRIEAEVEASDLDCDCYFDSNLDSDP